MSNEDRPRGRAGILARLETMSDEERLPILKAILPHLTECQLSTDVGCVAYPFAGRSTFCPVKVGPCSSCCPEHECVGAKVDNVERLSDGTIIRRIQVGRDSLEGGEPSPGDYDYIQF
jgi:hypothetical protein